MAHKIKRGRLKTPKRLDFVIRAMSRAPAAQLLRKEYIVSKRVFRNRYDGVHYPGMVFTKPSKTSQCLAAEVNIHNIVDGHMTTDLPARKPLFTGELPKFETLQDAFNFAANAKSSFEQMDAKLRAKFDNSPEKMLKFCQDPKNYEAAEKLGLMHIDKPSGPVKVEVVNAPTTPEVTPSETE